MPSLRIWHLGQGVDHRLADGVNAVVWLVGAEQARLGARPVLVNRRPLTAEGRAFARGAGIDVLTIPGLAFGFLPTAVAAALRQRPPDLVHFHSVFIPHQAILAGALRHLGIPYVVTPHGGLSLQVLARGRLKKAVYAALVERRRIERAVLATVLTEGEAQEVRAFTAGGPDRIRTIANPVADSLLDAGELPPNPDRLARPVFTFLGRYDVLHKGLDRLYRIAELMPEADFHLYGTEHGPTRAWLATLELQRLPNLELRPPVYGDAKIAVLRASTLYVQTSRWEGFPVSVAEAMTLGVPVAVSADLHCAAVIDRASAGLLLSADPVAAAAQLREALADPERTSTLGRNGRVHAEAHFRPESIARSFLEAYSDAGA